ncbi:MAG: hypothetical protein FWD79_09890 [Desulfobulbus sp.]|nr:hypothetical protein [Desulfobulbus sp.]
MIKKLLLILYPVVLIAGNLALIEWYAVPSDYSQIRSEFFYGDDFWLYTAFALVMLALALWYWLRKPGLISFMMVPVVVFVVCGIPGLDWKNTWIYGPVGGSAMHTWVEDEAKMCMRQGLPIYLNWREVWIDQWGHASLGQCPDKLRKYRPPDTTK